MALEAWNGRTSAQTDADSPIDVTLMDGIRKDIDHLRQTVYGKTGGGFFAPVEGHNHDGMNSQLLSGTPCMGTHFLGILNMPQNATRYFSHLGGATSASALTYKPAVNCTIRDLFVSINAALTSGTVTVTLMKNGMPTSLTIALSTSTGQVVSNTSNAVHFGTQDTISFKCDSTGIGTGYPDIVISYRHCTAGTSNGRSIVPYNSTTFLGENSHLTFLGGTSADAAFTRIPIARTTPVRTGITANTRIKWAVYVGASLLDPSFPDATALLDFVPYVYDATGGVAISGSWTIEDDITAGQSVGLMMFGSYNQTQGTTRYCNAPGQAGTATESEAQVPVKAGVLKNLALMHTGTAAGTSWTATVRKNGAATALTVPMTTETNKADTTHTVTVADGDLISVEIVSVGATGTRIMTASVEHVPA